MTLEPGSAEIVQLAWARRLGFDDGAFAAAAGVRLTRADETARSLQFVRLFGNSALVGPQWALDAADGSLRRGTGPARDAADHHPRARRPRARRRRTLLRRRPPPAAASGELTVSHGNPEAIELETFCPPDDVNEVGLADLEHRFTVLHLEDGRRTPVACGAYAEWEGLLAHMGVLVAPEWRRHGLGKLAASIAAHEALAAGLTLQWRSEVSNKGSLALARSLGFSAGGIQTSVLLG